VRLLRRVAKWGFVYSGDAPDDEAAVAGDEESVVSVLCRRQKEKQAMTMENVSESTCSWSPIRVPGERGGRADPCWSEHW